MGNFLKVAAAAAVVVIGGKYLLDWGRKRYPGVLRKAGGTKEAALRVSYTAATDEIAGALRALGISGNVSGGVFEGKPSIIVRLDRGQAVALARRIPSMSHGLPVIVQA